tara:strand:+ start:903 stop:1136 length:234 start_codon:yes stop_codon:yes gene_type:complete
VNLTTVCLILLAGFMAWENDRLEPKPYPLGFGDTLMVRIIGYDFCPNHCEVDHFHIGHFSNYDCENINCEHITINEE